MKRRKYGHVRTRRRRLGVRYGLALVALSFILLGGFFVFSGLNMDDIAKTFGELRDYVVELVGPSSDSTGGENASGEEILKIGVMSDTHGATDNIRAAVRDMKRESVDLIIHLGDFSAGGGEAQIAEAYQVLNESGLPFEVLPGDHDYNWVPEHSYSNFEKYFGTSESRVRRIGRVTLLFYSNATYRESNVERLRAILDDTSDVSGVKLLFSASPLYSPYFKSKEDESGAQALELLPKYGVRYAFSGDTHVFARYKDLSGKVELITVGALGEYKNPLEQWVLVTVSDNGDVEIESRPLVEF